MKKILVLTDFSKASDNAARYALHMARCLKANVQLVHVLPPANTAATAIAQQELGVVANRLGLELMIEKTHYAPAVYQPVLTHRIFLGRLADAPREALAQDELVFVVMGLRESDGLGVPLIRGKSYSMLQSANFPVLLVPPHAVFRGIHVSAFAGRVADEEVGALRELVGLMRQYNADIPIIHVRGYDDGPPGRGFAAFLNKLDLESNERRRLSLKEIVGPDIEAGIVELAAGVHADMVTMVHLEHGIFERLVHVGYTHAVSRRLDIPLLVFPAPTKALAF